MENYQKLEKIGEGMLFLSPLFCRRFFFVYCLFADMHSFS